MSKILVYSNCHGGRIVHPSHFRLFDGCYGEMKVWIDVYDYYYLRLSHSNFDAFLEEYSEIMKSISSSPNTFSSE